MTDALADYLRKETFSGGDDVSQRVLLRLYRRLAEGAPITLDALAAVASVRRTTVDRVVRSVLPTWLRYDAGRAIVAFGGLSLEPTAHRLTFEGRTLYAWCAFDALFLPELLGGTVRIASRCPVTAVGISLTVAPGRIETEQPAGMVMTFVMPETSIRCADIRGAFCDHVSFLASPAAGEAWLAKHPGGRIVDLTEALALAGIRNRAAFGKVLP